MPIQSWDQLLAACGEIAEGKHPFKTIIVDTVDNAYRMCADHVCAKFKIEHESDLGYGKGWALINNEFHRVHTKLAFLPYGLFLVSHSVEREIETRTGMVGVVHADIPPFLGWDEFMDRLQSGDRNAVFCALWSRDRLSAFRSGMPVAGGVDRVYCGHTPVRATVRSDNVYYIDTGAVYVRSGHPEARLTMVEVHPERHREFAIETARKV